MIVDVGKPVLLDFQASGLSGCFWGLFTSNTTITQATVLASLTEAAWTGYSRIAVGTMNAAVLIGHVANATPTSFPTFSNTSGSSQTCYGWFLVDSGGTVLIAAVNLGSTTIPDGGLFPLAPAITDNQA